MDAFAVTLVLATIFSWGVFSAKAQSAWLLSAPIVFVSAGFCFTEVVDVLHLHPEHGRADDRRGDAGMGAFWTPLE